MIMPHRCPVCEKEFEPNVENSESLFPFCSDRCRCVDLFRWFNGQYRVVEDIDPQTAELLQDDPNITVRDDTH